LINIDKETGLSKGSARSIKGFNLIEILKSCEDLLEEYGGHEFAAGFTVKRENIDKLRSRLIKLYDEIYKDKVIYPVLSIDMSITPQDINMKLYDDIFEKLAPFGEGNPLPVFEVKNLKIKDVKVFGGNHASLILTDGFYNLKAIGYNVLKNNAKFEKGKVLDIVFNPKLTFVKDITSLEMQIIDFRFLKEENGKEISKNDTKNIDEKIEKLKGRGNEEFFKGNFDRAIDFYFKALKLDKNNGKIYYNIALAYKKKGDKGRALQYFNKAAAKGGKEVSYKSKKNIKKIKNSRR
jgi:tetratricopeptide (TPR) repeat protein